VEELDRIIDDAKTPPLSEADSQKLKNALHALAENLLPQRNTEKTSSVFGDAEKAALQDMPAETDQPSGHGRNGRSGVSRGREGSHHIRPEIQGLKTPLLAGLRIDRDWRLRRFSSQAQLKRRRHSGPALRESRRISGIRGPHPFPCCWCAACGGR